jgi:hypothetical protein
MSVTKVAEKMAAHILCPTCFSLVSQLFLDKYTTGFECLTIVPIYIHYQTCFCNKQQWSEVFHCQ